MADYIGMPLDHLAAEGQGRYAGVPMVEDERIQLDMMQEQMNLDLLQNAHPQPGTGPWSALSTSQRVLSREHHTFLLANQHPSTIPGVRRLAQVYSREEQPGAPNIQGLDSQSLYGEVHGTQFDALNHRNSSHGYNTGIAPLQGMPMHGLYTPSMPLHSDYMPQLEAASSPNDTPMSNFDEAYFANSYAGSTSISNIGPTTDSNESHGVHSYEDSQPVPETNSQRHMASYVGSNQDFNGGTTQDGARAAQHTSTFQKTKVATLASSTSYYQREFLFGDAVITTPLSTNWPVPHEHDNGQQLPYDQNQIQEAPSNDTSFADSLLLDDMDTGSGQEQPPQLTFVGFQFDTWVFNHSEYYPSEEATGDSPDVNPLSSQCLTAIHLPDAIHPPDATRLPDATHMPDAIPLPGAERFQQYNLSSLTDTNCQICFQAFPKSLDLFLHMWTSHRDFMPRWKPAPCAIQPCKWKDVFPNFKAWDIHARRVHFKRHFCKDLTCPKRVDGPTPHAFGTKGEVARHRQEIHDAPIFCNLGGICPSPRKAKLNRRDKSAEHLLKWHGPIECEVPDCPRRHTRGGSTIVNNGFQTREDMVEHMVTAHGRSPSSQPTSS